MCHIFHNENLSRVVRNTRNPVYDEDFTFYGLNMNELKSMSLHFVVLSFDRYSRDDVIGEVVCALNMIDLHQIENQQVALSREIQPRRSLKVKLLFLLLIYFKKFIFPHRSNHKAEVKSCFHYAGNQQQLV